DYNETIIKGKKRNWEKHLSKNLSFPFDARIDEHQGNDLFRERGPLRYDDKVIVMRVTGEFDLYGVVAEIKKGRNSYEFPLCDLAIDDEGTPNYKELENYRVWFANCR
ncbi:MAG: calcium-binding protein, partial [Treponema sp.]|nr:calcium-binding protein [Treponema sp.]